MSSTWRPTADQRRLVRWAANSVGWAGPFIDIDDLQQVALTALWRTHSRPHPPNVADSTVVRSACLGHLQQVLGRAGSRKRADALQKPEPGAAVAWALTVVDWDTPDRILEAKQALAGFCGRRELHHAVLSDLVDGDLSRTQLASRHGCTVATIDHILSLARRAVVQALPEDRRCGPVRAGSAKAAAMGRQRAKQAAADVEEARELLASARLSARVVQILAGVVRHGGRAGAQQAGESADAIKWAFRQARSASAPALGDRSMSDCLLHTPPRHGQHSTARSVADSQLYDFEQGRRIANPSSPVRLRVAPPKKSN